jgi:hypothetical protein
MATELTTRADVLVNSLNWWKFAYGRVRIGKPSDVTHLFTDTSSHIVREGLARGHRVFAVPVRGGKGAFDKWRIDVHGRIARDWRGRQVIKKDWQTIAAAFLCSGKSKNIGSDELITGKEKNVEGIRRQVAVAVGQRLGIDPEKDAYLLFVRHPRQIRASVNELKARITYIKTRSPQAEMRTRIRFSLNPLPRNEEEYRRVLSMLKTHRGHDPVMVATITGLMRGVHPLIREAWVHYLMGTHLNTPEELTEIQGTIDFVKRRLEKEQERMLRRRARA